ncbi:MAG: leader peptidase (prepilin peptidase) / N-methyltransferase [Solirubrobacteraceae bacterium]|nr:leader peptidase (prepilin peptidase) / N-methyltransferase [Solirubrobacteraceae bacterium]
MAFAVALAAVGGLLVGSFLNVVVHRLPRGESLSRPRSRCPGCGTPIAPYDNVPVLSWLVLRGRCRHCGTRIAGRYPLVELVTAVLYVAVVLAKDEAVQVALGLLLVTALVPIALIDLEHRLIPNRITLPAAIAAVVAGLVLDVGFVPEQLIAGAAAGGFFLLAALAYPRGMGMGDVKLAGVLGLYLGRAVAPALFIALIAGVLVGALVIARKGASAGRKTAVPFGPFLALGGLVSFFVGEGLVDAYLDRF